VRITQRGVWAFVLLAGICFTALRARAQETQVLMPEQSAAKAKQLLDQAIQTLGGDAYLHVHDVTCTGRFSQFGHSGELSGFESFIDYTKLPDKERTEHFKKRNIIEVFNGKQGWVLDKAGVSDAPEDATTQFQDDLKKDLDNLLRNRIKEPGVIFRYAGPDVVDLREVDWVELVDPDGRTIRIAFVKATHLPIRKVIVTRDPSTRLRSEEVEYYSLYQSIEGIQTPYQITRERNGIKIYQVFFNECKFNTGLSDSLFTKESLDERWAQVGKKEKKKAERPSSAQPKT
jgi:hypothetical protein